jgi:ABC-2 type transport system permease protein
MLSVIRKEIGSFFSSLTGYVVIAVYIIINGMFMWILPGEWNTFDNGYASLDTFFIISPWVFLFLVPAVSMRMFAEERRSGTLELLLTRPLTVRDIVYGKYISAVILVLLSLLPSLFYIATICILGETPCNLDRGATAGAYIGLFLLASVYAAVGLFASAITVNQVAAFIIAVFGGFILYAGFDAFAMLPGLRAIDETIISLGINEHYRSVSRGVIDLRDLLYFAVVALIFTEAAALQIVSRNWRKRT